MQIQQMSRDEIAELRRSLAEMGEEPGPPDVGTREPRRPIRPSHSGAAVIEIEKEVQAEL